MLYHYVSNILQHNWLVCLYRAVSLQQRKQYSDMHLRYERYEYFLLHWEGIIIDYMMVCYIVL